MFEDTENPYAAPLTTTDPSQQRNDSLALSVPELESRSVILMIVLSVVTLGLYINYWTHRNSLVINRYIGNEYISMIAVYLFWAISLTSVGMIVPIILMDDISSIEAFDNFIDLADGIFALFMAFTVRGGLNAMVEETGDARVRFGGVWTFLFGIFYLQWKINRHREAGILTDEVDAASTWEN